MLLQHAKDLARHLILTFFLLSPFVLTLIKINGKDPYCDCGFGCTQRSIVQGYCYGTVISPRRGMRGRSLLC